MPEFPIVPWAPPAPSAEHVSRCDALGLPHVTDLRRAGDVEAWAVGERQRGHQFAAYDDVTWTCKGGARRSLRALVRASGHDPVAPEYRTASLAVRDWSLSPSGRHLTALVQHGTLMRDTRGKRSLGFLVVDTQSGAVEPVEVERDDLNPSLLRAWLVSDDAVVSVSWDGLRLFLRTSDGWREGAKAACSDAHRAAVGVHRGRVTMLLCTATETAVWTLRDGAFERLGRVLTFAIDLAVTGDALGLWITACDPLLGITPASAAQAAPFEVLLDEALPAAAKPAKAPKVALSLVADPTLVPTSGALARGLAWLRPMTQGMTLAYKQREVTLGGRTVQLPTGSLFAVLTERGRWRWCVADGVVWVADRTAATAAWERVIPQAGRPRAVAGLDDDTVAVLQSGYANTKDEALLLCRRGPAGGRRFRASRCAPTRTSSRTPGARGSTSGATARCRSTGWWATR